MKQCKSIRERFSAYLDGALTGVAMQQIAAHLASCGECEREFAGWRGMQAALGQLGPAKAPADLALRLRVALSQEQARTPKESFARWHVRWENTLAPFLLRASPVSLLQCCCSERRRCWWAHSRRPRQWRRVTPQMMRRPAPVFFIHCSRPVPRR